MIIPIGHESSDTRRVPWITALIIGLCLGAWVFTLAEVATLPSLPPEHYKVAAHRFWQERPFLEPDGELAVYMILREDPDAFPKDDPTQDDWELWLTNKRLGSSQPIPRDGAEIETLQDELNRLIAFGFYLEPDEIPPEGESPARRFGLIPAQFTWSGLFTHMFMHGSWAHIIGNLLLFFLVAPAMEDRWGRPLFTAFYLGAGLFAGGFYMALSMDSRIPLVGASGAIAGVMGSFLVLYWRTKIKFLYFFLFLPPIWGTFSVAAWLVLPLWFANEMTSAWVTHSAGVSTGIAYWAHVGGFLFGTAFAMSVKGLRLEEKFLHGAIERKVTLSQGKAALEQARLALEEGVYEEAFLLFQQESQNHPGDRDAMLGFWEAAVAFYQPEEGAAALLRWLEDKHTRGDHAAVADTWVRAVEISPAFDLPPRLLMPVATLLAKQNRTEDAARALQYLLSDENTALSGGMAMRIRDMARSVDPATELRALIRVLDLADLPVPKRERIEADMARLQADGVVAAADPLRDALGGTGHAVDADGAIPIALDEPQISTPEPIELSEADTESSDCDDSPFAARLPGQSLDDPDLDLEIDDDIAIDTSAAMPRFGAVKYMEVSPVKLESNRLGVRTGDGRSAGIGLAKVDGISVAIVAGLSAKPVLVIDLLLNWCEVDAHALRVVRMRSDGFDPRRLVPAAADAMEAVRGFVAALCESTGAAPLPDADALAGRPFARFDDLATYEREVLHVEA